MKPAILQKKFVAPMSGGALAIMNSALELGLPWWAVLIYCATAVAYAAIEQWGDIERMRHAPRSPAAGPPPAAPPSP